jgi:hypothetical protein
MLVDTHAHVHFNAYKDDMAEVIKRSLDRGAIINLVGTQKDTSKKGVEVANLYPRTFASIGLHPEHLFSKWVDEAEGSFQSREEDFDYEYYKKLAEGVVAGSIFPTFTANAECRQGWQRITPNIKGPFHGSSLVAKTRLPRKILLCGSSYRTCRERLLCFTF